MLSATWLQQKEHSTCKPLPTHFPHQSQSLCLLHLLLFLFHPLQEKAGNHITSSSLSYNWEICIWQTFYIMYFFSLHIISDTQGIHYTLSLGRRADRCFTISRKARVSSWVAINWKDKQSNLQQSPFLSLVFSFDCWARHQMVWNSPWASQGHQSQLCPPLSLFHTAHWWGSLRNRKGLEAQQ